MPLVRWLSAINASGLLAIVRVGPYVTAEYDWGGLPFWLSTVSGLKLRTNSSLWLSFVDRYFDQLIPLLLPFQYANGGPIISMQVQCVTSSFTSVYCFYEILRCGLLAQVEDDTDTPISASETAAYYSHLIDGLRSRGVITLISTLCGFWSGAVSAR
jgi:hypothetical protein